MIYCVSFTGVFFIGTAIDLACGPEPDPYDYYVTFFHNNLQKSDGYRPFYFSGYTFMNGYTYDVENDNKAEEADINVKEWMAYLGPTVTYKDVSRIFYESDKKRDSLNFWNYPKQQFADSIKNNSFIRKLFKKKGGIAYLILAKKTEPFVNPSSDDEWKMAEASYAREYAFALKFIEMGDKLHDRFLKLRCYYQAQRLLHHGRYTKEAEAIYDEHVKDFRSATAVKGWMLNLKAGEEDRLGHAEQAAYLYSKVFAISPERRVRAYNDFLRTKASIKSVIKLAKNNHEKAVIYAIKGFRNPRISLIALNNVYKTDPGAEVLTVLLAREINKVEEHYLTPRFNGSKYYDSIGFWDHDKYDSVKTYYTSYIPKLKAFCGLLATEHKCPEPALGYLGSAYLSWMTGETEAGLDTLNRINDTGLRGKLYDEKQLVKLLLLSQSIKNLDSASENELLPSLVWLQKKVKQEQSINFNGNRYRQDYDLKYYSASSRDFYAKVLARMYFKQRDTVKAALCILKSERTILTSDRWEDDAGLGFDMPNFWQTAMHSWQFEKILEWDHSAQKTPYLKLLMAEFHEPTVTTIITMEKSPAKGYYLKNTKKSPVQSILPAVYDLLGTTYLREHRYAQAVKAFRHVRASKLNHAAASASGSLSGYPNPFTDLVNDRTATSEKTVDNKLIFATKMARLQKQIKTDPSNAGKYYYKMALGLYNTSYYGCAWYYTAYRWSSHDVDPHAKVFYYTGDYFAEKSAERYFLKARGRAKDDELRAKCTFMAARCRQKQIQIPDDYGRYLTGRKYELDESTPATQKYDQTVRINPYFKTMRDRYSATAFYKLAVSDCSYFRDFLHSNK